jgi:hypothetical protein
MTPEDLPAAQARMILESPVLREFRIPEEDVYHYAYVVKMISCHLATLERIERVGG